MAGDRPASYAQHVGLNHRIRRPEPMTDEMTSPGVARYVAAAQEAAGQRAAELAAMRACRFDTIAVHGLYTMREAIENIQGSIIEPVYLSSSQGYRDSDEMEAELSYQIHV